VGFIEQKGRNRMRNQNLLAIALGATLALGSVAPAALIAQNAPTASAESTGWVGISFREGDGQVTVAQVLPDAPAGVAGLRRGDRIIRWNNRTDVAEAIRSTAVKPGDTVRLTVAARNGQAERELTITAVERPAGFAFGRAGGPGGPGGPGGAGRPGGPPPMAFGFGGPRGGVAGPRPNRDRFDFDLQVDSLNSRLRGFFRDSLSAIFPNGRQGFGQNLGPRLRENLGGIGGIGGINGPGGNGGSLGLALVAGRRAVAGAEMTDITSGLSSYFGTETGALVVRVAPESPAAQAGLRDGDVILSVNGGAVKNVADLRWQLMQPGVREFRLEVLRNKSRTTVTLGMGAA
jgi:membrane-associated protease RseP (regulator of RpoE activity)